VLVDGLPVPKVSIWGINNLGQGPRRRWCTVLYKDQLLRCGDEDGRPDEYRPCLVVVVVLVV
jgi:hypothetical protein